jgi:hypothetical protein
MPTSARTILKVTGVGGLLVVAAATAASRLHRWPATGEEGLQVWYYDQSARALYAVPRDTVPPHCGVGGEKNDGVKAMVVAGHGECADRQKRRIAYLETYTPEHQRLVEGVRAARTAGRAYGQPIPEAESGFYEKNTLVRRVDDPTWYDLSTVTGKQIVAQWRSERGPDGKALDVCTP